MRKARRNQRIVKSSDSPFRILEALTEDGEQHHERSGRQCRAAPGRGNDLARALGVGRPAASPD